MQLIGAALGIHVHAPARRPVYRGFYVAGHRLHRADRRFAERKPMPAFAHLRHSCRIFALTQWSPPLRALPRLIGRAKGQPLANSIYRNPGLLTRTPHRNLSLATRRGRGCGRIVQHKILPAPPAHG